MVTSTIEKTTAEYCLGTLYRGISPSHTQRIRQALHCIAQHSVSPHKTRKNHLELAIQVFAHIRQLRFDVPTRIAALCATMDMDPYAPIEESVLQNGDLDVQALLGTLLKTMQLEKVIDSRTFRQAVHQETTCYHQEIMGLAKDIRVIVIVMAIQLEQLRYLLACGTHSLQKTTIAQECLALYVPIAHRLGLWYLKWEMEDCAFHILEPEHYRTIANKLDERRTLREHFIARTVQHLRRELLSNSIPCTVHGRPKHIYSIYNKMKRKRLLFEDLYDLLAVRILVPHIKDCYSALGVVHNLWVPISQKFDDYIVQPKNNAYQSLHTAVVCDSRPIEVQIRTYDMHKHAELGIAAHWQYKEGVTTRHDWRYQKVALLRQLLSWRNKLSQTTAAYRYDTVYIFTPAWQSIPMLRNTTLLPVAYAIHNLGHRSMGGNDPMVSGGALLHATNRMERLTPKNSEPCHDGLDREWGFFRTTRGRQKVQWSFAPTTHKEIWTQGLALLQKAMDRLGLSQGSVQELVKKLNLPSLKHLYTALYQNTIRAQEIEVVIAPLTEKISKAFCGELEKKTRLMIAVWVMGLHGLSTQVAQCCTPKPGDVIVGFMTRGRSIAIHHAGCSQVQAHNKQDHFVDVQWETAGVGYTHRLF